YHFEFLGTDGIEVIDSQLLAEPYPGSAAARKDDAVAPVAVSPSRFTRRDSNRVHHYWADAASVDRVTAIFRLRVARENFVGPAYLAAWGVALTILACGLLAQPLVRHG